MSRFINPDRLSDDDFFNTPSRVAIRKYRPQYDSSSRKEEKNFQKDSKYYHKKHLR